jgi:hypothetical protein
MGRQRGRLGESGTGRVGEGGEERRGDQALLRVIGVSASLSRMGGIYDDVSGELVKMMAEPEKWCGFAKGQPPKGDSVHGK